MKLSEEPHVAVKLNRIQEEPQIAKIRRRKIIEEEKRKQKQG